MQGIIEIKNGKISDFLLYDSYFQFFSGVQHTDDQYGILFISAHRKLYIKALNVQDYFIMLYYLYKAV